MAKKKSPPADALQAVADYGGLLADVVSLLESARHTSVRAVNAVMTATYWEIGRRIVEVEQRGDQRADYGDELMKRLASDLTIRFGRGFSVQNIYLMRAFFQAYPQILQTVSGKSADPKLQTLSGVLQAQHPENQIGTLGTISAFFPLPWSHYVKLLSVKDDKARTFYEKEALRGGWSVRQLDRQVSTLFYQRTLLSKNKAAMLRKGSEPQAEDLVTPDEEIKDPLVLEFLNLKDEYSEHELEDALIHKLEDFLLELGSDFAFMGRQKRLRIGDEWYRIDLLFFHRRLKCLVVIDLKLGKLTHSDTGQMHMYLNYAREHWTHEDENPPVGLILCAEKNEAVAHYSLEGLPNKVMATEYLMALPDEKLLTAELEKTHRAIELKAITSDSSPRKSTTGRKKKKTSN
jgi:predicted nuclease of restriction endonuclease-like (RecB) superfamily